LKTCRNIVLQEAANKGVLETDKKDQSNLPKKQTKCNDAFQYGLFHAASTCDQFVNDICWINHSCSQCLHHYLQELQPVNYFHETLLPSPSLFTEKR